MESLSLCLNTHSIKSTTARQANVFTSQSKDKLRLKVSDKLSVHNLPINTLAICHCTKSMIPVYDYFF